MQKWATMFLEVHLSSFFSFFVKLVQGKGFEPLGVGIVEGRKSVYLRIYKLAVVLKL